MQQAWKITVSPLSSSLMLFVMFFFMGKSINIISIMMIFSFLSSQLYNITNVNKKFEHFSNKKLEVVPVYKMIFVFLNLVVVGGICFQLYRIGFLPLNPSDYVDLLP